MLVTNDGSQTAKALFYSKMRTGSLQYSHDGSQILFVSSRVIILLLVFIKMTKHGFNTWRLHLQPINLHPGRLMAK
ncbi:MAG: hypothetical protein ACTHKY_18370 [Ginsengibacter sp.]